MSGGIFVSKGRKIATRLQREPMQICGVLRGKGASFRKVCGIRKTGFLSVEVLGLFETCSFAPSNLPFLKEQRSKLFISTRAKKYLSK
jgi:hypothetical protein